MQNEIVREQFNKQAQNFDAWSITCQEQYLQAFHDFVGLKPGDDLLEIACGTGAFALFAAQRVGTVTGVDIAEEMLQVGRQAADRMDLKNIRFIRQDAEQIPFPDQTFSAVCSRSAFHHMPRIDLVFDEMVRCCRKGGKIGLQDIVAFNQEQTDSFFEKLEKAIDTSHFRTYTKRELFDLFKTQEIKVERLFEKENELNLNEYIGHAVQTAENKQEIERLIQFGMQSPDIAPCLIKKNEQWFFKRKVFIITGIKQD